MLNLILLIIAEVLALTAIVTLVFILVHVTKANRRMRIREAKAKEEKERALRHAKEVRESVVENAQEEKERIINNLRESNKEMLTHVEYLQRNVFSLESDLQSCKQDNEDLLTEIDTKEEAMNSILLSLVVPLKSALKTRYNKLKNEETRKEFKLAIELAKNSSTTKTVDDTLNFILSDD